MKKITQIQISNYRAFYNEKHNKSHINDESSTNDNIIKLNNGENVLIYGENGSGKSSLFHALKDFFESASTGDVDFAAQWNMQVPVIVEKYKTQGRKCYLADLNKGISWNIEADLSSDKLHPSASGNEKIADFYLSVLKQFLK